MLVSQKLAVLVKADDINYEIARAW